MAPKRQRIAISCSTCRKRKIKCDKQKPICSTCSKNGFAKELCIYDESPFISSAIKEKALYDEIDVLKKKIKSLEHENALQSRQRNKGVNNDIQDKHIESDSNPEMYCLKEFIIVRQNSNKSVFFGPTSWRTLVNLDPYSFPIFEKFSNKINLERSKWKMEHLKESRHFKLSLFIQCTKMDHSASHKFVESLEDFLPSLDIVLENITYTFEYNRMISNLFDREMVFHDIGMVFHRDTANPQKIKIVTENGETDFAVIASILILLKFSTLTILPKCQSQFEPKHFDDDDEMILSLLPPCLLLANSFIKATLPALQTLVSLRIYKNFNPNDGDGGDPSNGSMLFGLAFSMAISLGLHRNIDHIYRNERCGKRKMLKYIWRWILYYDAVQSFSLGIPSKISDEDFESDFESDSDGLDDDLLYHKRTVLIRDVMQNILSVNKKINIEEQIGKVKSFISEYCPLTCAQLVGRFYEEKLSVEEVEDSVRMVYIQLTLYNMIQTLYHLLYLKNLKDGHAKNIQKYRAIAMKYSILSLKISEIALKIIEKYDSLPTDNKLTFLQVLFMFLIKELSLRSSILLISVLLKKISEIEKDFLANYNKYKSLLNKSSTVSHLSIEFLQDFKNDDESLLTGEEYKMLFDDIYGVNTFLLNFHEASSKRFKEFYTFLPVYICSKNFCSYIKERLKYLELKYFKLYISETGLKMKDGALSTVNTMSSSTSNISIKGMNGNGTNSSAYSMNELSSSVYTNEEYNQMHSEQANPSSITPDDIFIDDFGKSFFQFEFPEDNFQQLYGLGEFKDLFYL